MVTQNMLLTCEGKQVLKNLIFDCCRAKANYLKINNVATPEVPESTKPDAPEDLALAR